MTLDARAWIYLEGTLRFPSKKLKYITDIKEDPVSCDQFDLFDVLHKEHQFSRKDTEYINDLLNGGRGVILNLLKKEILPQNQEPILLKTEVIRDPRGERDKTRVKGLDLKKVQDIVNGKYFSQ